MTRKKKRILGGSKYITNDCHLHVNNFIQEGGDLRNLITQMNKANIKKAVIMGLPVKKIYSEYETTPPKYYLDNNTKCIYYNETDDILAENYSKLKKQHKERLIPLMCGFNPMDRFAINTIKRKFERYKGVFKGIGEILLRHDDLTNLTIGETPRCNSLAMMDIANFCREKNIPMLVHQNVTSIGLNTHPEYLRELHQLLQKNPNTKIIWAHCGISRRVTVPNYEILLRNLMNYYHNLYLDFTWVFFDDNICPNGNPLENWLQLTEDFSDRIMIGSDLVINFELLGHTIKRYDNFLDKLNENTRKKICQDNCNNIFKNN